MEGANQRETWEIGEAGDAGDASDNPSGGCEAGEPLRVVSGLIAGVGVEKCEKETADTPRPRMTSRHHDFVIYIQHPEHEREAFQTLGL